MLGWDKGHVKLLQCVTVVPSRVEMSYRELKPSKLMGSYVHISTMT